MNRTKFVALFVLLVISMGFSVVNASDDVPPQDCPGASCDDVPPQDCPGASCDDVPGQECENGNHQNNPHCEGEVPSCPVDQNVCPPTDPPPPEVCPWDETIPEDSDECVKLKECFVAENCDDPTKDRKHSSDDSSSVDVPQSLVQITVWPDTYQLGNVSGYAWSIGDNMVEDPEGVWVVTGVEYRNRQVQGSAVVVENQAMSRLVLNLTVGEAGDLEDLLSQFKAYMVVDGVLVPVNGGWYDIDGEFLPIAPGTGVSVYSPQE